MSRRYSIFTLARNAIGNHEGWAEAWRSPEPKHGYQVIVIGGHGLATARALARCSKNGSTRRRPRS
jgi:sarcosine oxidase subunit beta